jgi:hypothetical protein
MRQTAAGIQVQEDMVLTESERRIRQQRPQNRAAPPMFVVRVVNDGLMQLYDAQPCGQIGE